MPGIKREPAGIDDLGGVLAEISPIAAIRPSLTATSARPGSRPSPSTTVRRGSPGRASSVSSMRLLSKTYDLYCII